MSNITRTFTLAQLKEWGGPYELEVDIVDELGGGRWYDDRTVVFKAPDDGFLYQIIFSVGKTETQWVDWYEELAEELTLPRVELGVRIIEEEYWKPVEG